MTGLDSQNDPREILGRADELRGRVRVRVAKTALKLAGHSYHRAADTPGRRRKRLYDALGAKFADIGRWVKEQ